MLSLTLKNLLAVNLVSKPLFEGLEGNVFFRPSPHANLKAVESRSTVSAKMELFDQVTFCLGFSEKKTILLVVKARAF